MKVLKSILSFLLILVLLSGCITSTTKISNDKTEGSVDIYINDAYLMDNTNLNCTKEGLNNEQFLIITYNLKNLSDKNIDEKSFNPELSFNYENKYYPLTLDYTGDTINMFMKNCIFESNAQNSLFSDIDKNYMSIFKISSTEMNRENLKGYFDIDIHEFGKSFEYSFKKEDIVNIQKYDEIFDNLKNNKDVMKEKQGFFNRCMFEKDMLNSYEKTLLGDRVASYLSACLLNQYSKQEVGGFRIADKKTSEEIDCDLSYIQEKFPKIKECLQENNNLILKCTQAHNRYKNYSNSEYQNILEYIKQINSNIDTMMTEIKNSKIEQEQPL